MNRKLKVVRFEVKLKINEGNLARKRSRDETDSPAPTDTETGPFPQSQVLMLPLFGVQHFHNNNL